MAEAVGNLLGIAKLVGLEVGVNVTSMSGAGVLPGVGKTGVVPGVNGTGVDFGAGGEGMAPGVGGTYIDGAGVVGSNGVG